MMNKTTALRLIIRKLLLLAVDDDNLFEGFNSGDMMPKVNYKLTNMSNDDECDSWMMEINIWTNDSLLADKYADSIENALNFVSIVDNGCNATFYLQMRRSIDDSDPKIERRSMTYSIENYFKEVTNEK